MQSRKQYRRGGTGRLPDPSPLANPYVPFQQDDPPKYDPNTAFVRGTLFPGLDLPFMDMVNNKIKPATKMNELQTLAFVIQELALYLDTHKDDMQALQMYRTMQQMYNEASRKYEAICGPLTHKSMTDGPYKWLDDPWPWEYAKNREV